MMTTGGGDDNASITQTSKRPPLQLVGDDADACISGGDSSAAGEDGNRESQPEQPLQLLPEATNDPSIPTIKLGGTSGVPGELLFSFHLYSSIILIHTDSHQKMHCCSQNRKYTI